MAATRQAAAQREQLHRLLVDMVSQSSTFQAVDAHDLRLQGKLELLCALMQALGRYSFDEGRACSGSLVFRLISGTAAPYSGPHLGHLLADQQCRAAAHAPFVCMQVDVGHA